uniref:Origin recognition complex subunit 3 N-terminal domain-containing protein n=1 Tax=Glossina pallidipes TaxID=7398 RepID=A0A1A9ZRA0_GLOPL
MNMATNQNENYYNGRIIEDLLNYALLTGINQSDHLQQFNTLSKRLKEKISVDVCVLQSIDCSSTKTAVELERTKPIRNFTMVLPTFSNLLMTRIDCT